MNKKLTLISLFLCLFLWPLGRVFANVERVRIPSVFGGVLNIEFLTDSLIHFELTGSTADASMVANMIPVTPMVKPQVYLGPSLFVRNENSFETASLKIEVDSSTLCLSPVDKKTGVKLTMICPRWRSENPAGLTIDRGVTQNTYGLAEEFLNPGGDNGDWINRVRSSPNPYGNVLEPFAGGAVENAQFPVLYLVGKNDEDYALFLDNSLKQTWNLGRTPWRVDAPGGKTLRWFLIGGSNLPSLRTQFMGLVGHPMVPPKKAFGLWVSQFGFRNWAEMEGKLKTLRANHFPIEGFVLDLYWYGLFNGSSPANKFGRLSWDLKNFAHPKKEIKKLAKEGLGLILIEESYVEKALPEFKTLAKKGFLVKDRRTGKPLILSAWWGKGGMLDWTNSKASAFWADWKRRALIEDGVLGHWTDLGEPETYSTHSFYSGIAGVSGHGEKSMHNLYSLMWIKGIAEGYSRRGIRRRPFILSRSGSPGVERFGAAMWSGDIGSNLRSLASQMNVQAQMSLSGVDYFGSDVGGFHREVVEGNEAETYTRWLAHSCLLDVPVRPHDDDGNRYESAPDRLGDLKSNLANVRLRYALSPYYYSLAYRAYLYGEPLAPPLVYYYEDDLNARLLTNEKLIGRDLLAAAAWRPGETSRSVYLPLGTWIDYHTGSWYHSPGRWFSNIPEYQDGIFRLPLFARAGAIIPEMKVDDQTMNILGQRKDGSKDDAVRVRVFVSTAPSRFTLFEDDGWSTAYKKGDRAQTFISQKEIGTVVQVSFSPRQGFYAGMPKNRCLIVELVTENGKVARVIMNGRDLPKKSGTALSKTKTGRWFAVRPGLTKAESDPLLASRGAVFRFVIEK